MPQWLQTGEIDIEILRDAAGRTGGPAETAVGAPLPINLRAEGILHFKSDLGFLYTQVHGPGKLPMSVLEQQRLKIQHPAIGIQKCFELIATGGQDTEARIALHGIAAAG